MLKRLLIPTRIRLEYLRHNTNTATAAAPPTGAAPHVPVLCDIAIEYLKGAPGRTFFDMTFGAGGHTRRLLDTLPDAKVYALDRDPVAYQLAQDLSETEEYKGRIIPLLGKFSDIPRLFAEQNLAKNSIDGMLFDFGCSSMQFDEAARGFSISHDGPLDMRMDGGLSGGLSAADVLAKVDEGDLVKILRIYGEEKAAKKIARYIVDARNAMIKIETTRQLANLVEDALDSGPRKDKLQRPAHSATKTFQALRIFVNNELNEINYGMLLANEMLRLDGRLVTITFHSLEDTIVKRHINGHVVAGAANPLPLKYSSHELIDDPEMLQSLNEKHWRQLHRHVIVPDPEEVSRNSRSRSAKLRAAVKISAPQEFYEESIE
ncbi:probable methyltransferase-like protein 15 homolog [Drosophila pseudoobscura]|uniref:Probable methyltransferase-like protein 15 homolog n=1 Tax=Drosophila pseudoobscura pseudoobscura TaxID=46245 RepID=A0A6I8VQ05_DROPS|nr:probable methyltransferase-like protein 15 homolog [Drosophila pseudoobscura]XP_033233131.1 probable methyltransferase-like protein 15 homolog [Drosophila pseudoobscura]